jgi:hypothetical protein
MLSIRSVGGARLVERENDEISLVNIRHICPNKRKSERKRDSQDIPPPEASIIPAFLSTAKTAF